MDLSRLKTTRSIVNLKQGRNDWYRIKAQAGGISTQVMVYDEIGFWGVTAQDFINDLKQVSGPVDLHLNSPGGEVFDGIAIYQYLSGRGDVTTYVDSLAASIASVIAMAGTEIVMGRNASMMIHDGFGLVIGNAADMRDQADLLDRVSDNIASIYADRTGKPTDFWRTAMLAETWYIGQEAVDAGLADRLAVAGAATAGSSQTVVPGAQPDEQQQDPAMAAHFDLSIFRNVPKALRNQAEQAVPEPTPPRPEAVPDIEAPVDTDRGFVVPETESQGNPVTEPETPPQETATQSAPDAAVIAALVRKEIRALAIRAPEPLGMDTMPLLNKAIPVHHTPTVDTPWDGPAAVAAMPAEYADLHYCNAWQSADADSSSHTPGDDDVDDKKSSFKFPHHAKDDAPANLPACRNGMARLPGADIPDTDRAGVKAHLQAHLDDASKDDDEAKNHAPDEIAFAWVPSMTAALKEAMQ